jgi:outer membrane protein assembly factor BamA
MRLQLFLPLLALLAIPAATQTAVFPLESVGIEGSSIPQSVILDMAGLKVGVPIDKAGIEQACKGLQESGLFASISYRYAPGPQKGYALTLILADQAPLAAATIDVPGGDEIETWKWLTAKFHRFDHEVPQVDAAHKYLAAQIEQHLGSRMRGQRLTVRMESDLKTRKLTLSFQPEVLPRVQSVTFTGNQAVTSAELSSVLNGIVANQEYTDRKFAAALELNLRPVYEQHGYHRVAFASANTQLTESGVSVNVVVTEGAALQLGKVELIGENLPVDAMLSSAKLPKGKLANWKQIQEGIWEMEKVLKRAGFFETTASPDRAYDDNTHALDLRIPISRGPLYHFGQLRISGLSPELQERARQMWRPKSGDPYDYSYTNEFFQTFSRVVDFRNLRKYDAVVQKGVGDHVMDINLVFESR